MRQEKVMAYHSTREESSIVWLPVKPSGAVSVSLQSMKSLMDFRLGVSIQLLLHYDDLDAPRLAAATLH